VRALQRFFVAGAAFAAGLGPATAAAEARAPSPRLITVGRPIRFQLEHDTAVSGSTRARLIAGRREVAITSARRRGRTVSVVVRSSDVTRLGASLASQHDRATLRVYIGRREVVAQPAVIRPLAHPGSTSPGRDEPTSPTSVSGTSGDWDGATGASGPAGIDPTTNGGSSGGTAGLPTRLSWAPPQMTDPTTITAQSGLDPDHLTLSPSRDYIVKLPQGGLDGTLEIDGGHNVILIGGAITVPATADQTDNGADDTDTALYVRGSTGTVHIEGVLIDAASDVMFDGIDVDAPQATVDVENVRVRGVYGSYPAEHADVIQTWGGAKALRVDHLTADGDYQGLQIAPDLGSVGFADLRNVDLTLDPRPQPSQRVPPAVAT
jgi:hypothetical protein